jgi:hypothetical protein
MDIAADVARALVDDQALAALASNRAGLQKAWEAGAAESLDRFLAWRIQARDAAGWPPSAVQRARLILAEAAAIERAQHAELDRVTAALGDGGVSALVMKGAAVAYSHYPEPSLRPRAGLDLVVAKGDRGEAERILSAAGYEPDLKAPRAPASGQCRYRRRDRQVPEPIELHWRVTDSVVIGEPLPFADAWRRRVAIPSLGHAMTFGPSDRLLVACLQRAAERERAPLVSLLDIHLLAAATTLAQWQDFLDRASGAPIQPACIRSLQRAADVFSTCVPADVREWLQQRVPAGGGAVSRVQAPPEYRHRSAIGVWDFLRGR